MYKIIVGGKILKLITHGNKVVAYDVQCTDGYVYTLSKEEILGFVLAGQIINATAQYKGTGFSINVGSLKSSREAKPEEMYGGVFLSSMTISYVENLVLKQGHTIMFPMRERAVYVIDNILYSEQRIMDRYLTSIVYGSGDKTSKMASILVDKITTRSKNISELILATRNQIGVLYLTKETFPVEDGYNTMDIKKCLLKAFNPEYESVPNLVSDSELRLGKNATYLEKRLNVETAVVNVIKQRLNSQGFYITNSPAGEKGHTTGVVYFHLRQILGEELYKRAGIENLFNCRRAFMTFFENAGLRATVLSYNPGKFTCRHDYEALAFWKNTITVSDALFAEYLERLKNAAKMYLDLGQSTSSVFNSMFNQIAFVIGNFMKDNISPVYFMREKDYVMYSHTSFDRMLGGLLPAVVFREVDDPSTKSIRFRFIDGTEIIGRPHKAPTVTKKLNELYDTIINYEKPKSQNAVATIMNS